MNFLDPSWIIGGFVGLLALIAAFFGVKSSGKKEGVQQERAKQVETARKETAVAIDTKNRVEAQPKSVTAEKFATYVRKGNGK